MRVASPRQTVEAPHPSDLSPFLPKKKVDFDVDSRCRTVGRAAGKGGGSQEPLPYLTFFPHPFFSFSALERSAEMTTALLAMLRGPGREGGGGNYFQLCRRPSWRRCVALAEVSLA